MLVQSVLSVIPLFYLSIQSASSGKATGRLDDTFPIERH